MKLSGREKTEKDVLFTVEWRLVARLHLLTQITPRQSSPFGVA